MRRARDQHGFVFTTCTRLFRGVVAAPVVLLYLLLFDNNSWIFKNVAWSLDWISNIMNIIDSLTLLILTLSAVKSAHIPKETERSPHEVIPLLEVFNKSLCKPREMLVEILDEYPQEVEYIFIPSCVVLTRCAGCCNDEMLQCVPTSSYNVTMEIKRLKPRRQENDVYMSFTEHSACECRVKKEVKEQKENLCEPCCDHCTERRRRLFAQDPATCRCSCKYTDESCKERQLELNERTCKCEKPRR
ncbi:vascular endothelial growth factor Ab isoform X2 [Brachionichthys hirsutus]|uniref:vascular endothelial growth factor Ab isoform X2 n=1 Tax=Brachionichthys hirsutus TaxID=412623 RepID=UPI003604F565